MPSKTRTTNQRTPVPFAHGQADGTNRFVDAGRSLWKKKRIIKTHFAPRFTALFCDASAGRRGGFARRAGITGPQRYQHDADLHARRFIEAQSDAQKISSARLIRPLPKRRFPACASARYKAREKGAEVFPA